MKKREVNAIISNYKNLTLPNMLKVEKNIETIKALQKENEELKAQIDALEVGTMQLTGYKSYELVYSEVVDTPNLDKNGKPIRKREYHLIPDMWSINEEKGEYNVVEKITENTTETELN